MSAERRAVPRSGRRRRRSGATLLGLTIGIAAAVGSTAAEASERSARTSTSGDLLTTSSRADVQDQDRSALTRDAAGKSRAERRGRLPHRGTILEASAGMLDCVGPLCESDRLATVPGARVGGFFGGNIHGWVEMGVTGGWSAIGSRVAPGTDALSLYGLDAARLEERLGVSAIPGLDLDTEGFLTQESRLKTVQVGPLARVHFNPRGRLLAWVGSGVLYHRLRNDLATERGRVRADFHGMAVPLEGGLGVAIHPNFSVVALFTYTWTRHLVTSIELPADRWIVPTTMLKSEGSSPKTDLSRMLPTFWNVALGVRTRF